MESGTQLDLTLGYSAGDDAYAEEEGGEAGAEMAERLELDDAVLALGEEVADEELLSDVDLGLSSSDVMGRIEDCVQQLLEALAEGRAPELTLVSRAASNARFYGPTGQQVAQSQTARPQSTQASVSQGQEALPALSLSTGSFGGSYVGSQIARGAEEASQLEQAGGNSNPWETQRPESTGTFGTCKPAASEVALLLQVM